MQHSNTKHLASINADQQYSLLVKEINIRTVDNLEIKKTI